MLQNQFDSIDLSDNAIIILEGFTKLPRLQTLLLSNNRVTRIGRALEGEQQGCAALKVSYLLTGCSLTPCDRSFHSKPDNPQPCQQSPEKLEGALV